VVSRRHLADDADVGDGGMLYGVNIITDCTTSNGRLIGE
jgi:hypothetical protein